MNAITYFDVSDIDYASFFVKGFIELAKKNNYRFRVVKTIPEAFEDTELGQAKLGYSKSLLFQIENGRKKHFFCIDAYDVSGANPDDPEYGYDLKKLELCDAYFKVNYRKDFVTTDPELAPWAEKIFPVGNVFPLRLPNTWQFLPKISPLGNGRRWPYTEIKRRVNKLRNLPDLNTFRSLRNIERDLDVFFLVAYYKTEQHRETNRWRLTLMEALSEHENIKTFIGFTGAKEEMPPEYARFHQGRMSFDTYLNNLARAKIGVYVRGTFGCLSYKFGQLLALGKPIVGETIHNDREILYRLDRFEDQFAYEDPQAIVERIIELLENPAELDALRAANTQTFEENLAPRPIVNNILNTLQI